MTNGARVRIRDYDAFAAEHDYEDGRGRLTRVRRGVGFGVSRVGFAFARSLARRELATIEAERKDAEIIVAALVTWFDAAQIDGYMGWGDRAGAAQYEHPSNASPDGGSRYARPAYYLQYMSAHYLSRCTLAQAIVAALFCAGRPMVDAVITRKEERRRPVNGGYGHDNWESHYVDAKHHVWRLATGPLTDVDPFDVAADIAAWKSIL